MTRTRIILLLPAILALASCANSVDSIVEAHHQARLEAANANRPINAGYADGMGALIADSVPK